jgi:hypothetical protein
VKKKHVLPATGVEPVRKPDWVWDILAAEYHQEVLDAALTKLRAAGEEGATLTEAECAALLVGIKQTSNKQPRRGRPPADTFEIAQWCRIYAAFMPLKVAVAKTMDQFGVKRAAVYAAKRKLLS